MYSEPGRGTTFKIYFPEEKEGAEELLTKKKDIMQSATETVPVADDEESILRFICDTLQPMGYRVLKANAADDAIEADKDPDNKIDLLLTGVIVPKMNGKELASSLEPLQPDMDVLFMSGKTDSIQHNCAKRDMETRS